MENDLDLRYFYPEIYQAVPGENYTVYAYVNDGSVRRFDARPFIEKGGVFECLKDEHIFRQTLTVIGNTVAWDLSQDRDARRCIDIDPFDIFNSPVVSDFPEDLL